MAQVLAAPFPYFGAAKRLANAELKALEAEVQRLLAEVTE